MQAEIGNFSPRAPGQRGRRCPLRMSGAHGAHGAHGVLTASGAEHRLPARTARTDPASHIVASAPLSLRRRFPLSLFPVTVDDALRVRP